MLPFPKEVLQILLQCPMLKKFPQVTAPVGIAGGIYFDMFFGSPWVFYCCPWPLLLMSKWTRSVEYGPFYVSLVALFYFLVATLSMLNPATLR